MVPGEQPPPMPPITPMVLIQQALASGVGVEALERLQVMAERAEDRQAEKDFNNALSSFQDVCPEIRRTQWGGKSGPQSKGQYQYAGLAEDILPVVRPLLAQNGLSYSWDHEVSGDGKMLKTTFILRHASGHSQRTLCTLPTASQSALQNAQQAMGSSMSYGDRYSMIAGLGLAGCNHDDDAAAADGLESLTAKQMGQLTVEINARDLDIPKLCTVLDIGSLDELTRGQFQTAMNVARLKSKVAS